MNEADLVQTMSALGLTKYEALAYTSLLRCSPQNPHQLSKQAGVPTAKIYEVVGRLRERGVVSELEGQGYIPRDPASLIRETGARYARDLTSVREFLTAEHSGPAFHATRNFRGRPTVISEGALLISQAEHRLALAASGDLVSAWAEDLDDAAVRGCRCVIVSYGEPSGGPTPEPTARRGSIEIQVVGRREFFGRLSRSSVLATDEANALFVRTDAGGEWQGTWTDNPAIAAVAVESVEDRHFLESAIANRWIRWGEAE